MILEGTMVFINPMGKLLANKPGEVDDKYLRYLLNPNYPQFTFLSIDSLGKGKLDNNPLQLVSNKSAVLISSKSDGNCTKYFTPENTYVSAWKFQVTKIAKEEAIPPPSQNS